MNNEKWYTIPKAYKDSDDLKVKYDNENNKEMLENLENLICLLMRYKNFQ